MKEKGMLVWIIIDHSRLLSITIFIDYYGTRLFMNVLMSSCKVSIIVVRFQNKQILSAV